MRTVSCNTVGLLSWWRGRRKVEAAAWSWLNAHRNKRAGRPRNDATHSARKDCEK